MKAKTHLGAFPMLLVLYEIACYLSNDAYLPALPGMTQHFAISHTVAQLTLTLWFFGAVFAQFIIGPLSDRFGRRAVLLIGGLFYVASSAVCAMAPNIHVLLIARVIEGMSIPSMIIPGYAAIHESLEKMQAISAIGKMKSVTILAPSLGPLLGSILLTFIDWRSIFVLLTLWGAIALLLLFFKMPDTLPVEERTTSLHLPSIAKQYWGVLTNKVFLQNAVGGSLLVTAFSAWMFAGPFLVTKTFHYSVVYFGVFQGLIFASFIFGMRSLGWWMKEHTIELFMRTGMLMSLLGVLIATVCGWIFPQHLWILIASMLLVGYGGGLCFPTLARLAIESSKEPMGVRMTMSSAFNMGVFAIATVVIGVFYTGSIFSLAVIALISTLLACAIRLRF